MIRDVLTVAPAALDAVVKRWSDRMADLAEGFNRELAIRLSWPVAVDEANRRALLTGVRQRVRAGRAGFWVVEAR